MNKRLITLPALLAALMLVAGCNTSGGDGGGGNGDNDTDNNDTGGNDNATTPDEARFFALTASLDYSATYGGESGWADPVIELDNSDPTAQPQRRAVDSVALGAALLPLVYQATEQSLDEEGLDDRSIFDFIDFSDCGADCVQSPTADNAEIQLTGSPELPQWNTAPGGDFDATAEFDTITGDWRGVDFEASGAMGLVDDNNQLHLALDLTLTGTGDTYRYWVTHTYDGLAAAPATPMIDLIAFHPQDGAYALYGESFFEQDSGCTEGGFEEKGAAVVTGASDASLTFGFEGCDLYGFDAANSEDANGDSPRPEVLAAYESLGLDFDNPVEDWASVSDEQRQLKQDETGTNLTPESVDIAKMGSEREGSQWTVYQIALSFDPADLPTGLDESDVRKAVLRLHQDAVGKDGNVYNFIAVPQDGDGDPAESDFLDNSVNPTDRVVGSGGNTQPWLSFEVTDMVKTAVDSSYTRLQIVVAASLSGDPSEGDVYQALCLEEAGDCGAGDLPTVSLALTAP